MSSAMRSMKREAWGWVLIAAGFFLLATGRAYADGPVRLAVEGQPAAVIVIPAGAGARSIERAAADLLQEFVERMSGAELPIHAAPEGAMWHQVELAHEGMNLVLIGADDLARQLGMEKGDIGPGGLRVKTFDKGVALLGGPERVEGEAGSDGGGVRHAAVELLERLGCRYLWPGRTGLVAPDSPSVAVPPTDYSYTPQIRMRRIRGQSFGGGRAMSGFNRLGLDEEGSWPREIPPKLRAAQQKAREGAPGIGWNAWQRLGGRMPTFGHAGAGLRNAGRHLEENPEWFAKQADGTRDQAGSGRWRLCKSNPDLIEHVANDIIQRRNENPNLELVSLCGNDGGGTTGFCLCEECLALDPPHGPTINVLVFPERERTSRTRERREMPSMTDRHVYYWNAIAKRVTEVHPDLRFGVSAYSVHSHPPVERNLHPNLVVRYVPGSAERIGGWIEKGMVNVFWRPNILLANRRHGRLRSIVGRLCQEMNAFADAGLVQTDFDSNLGYWATFGLSYYAAARLNWNPRLCFEEIIQDYAQAGFGDGAEHIVEYFNRIEEGGHGLDDIPYLRERLNLAEHAADDELVSERIAFLRLGLNFTHLHELMADKNRRMAEAGTILPRYAGDIADRELGRRLIDLNCLALRDLLLHHYNAINVSYLVWGSGTFAAFSRIRGRTVHPSDEALLERVGHPDYGWTGREDSMEEMLAAFGL